MIYSLLVVDDYEPWRRQIHTELRRDARWMVVGESADGLNAIHQAGALDPDVILLDIGLPGVGGIEAARRILTQNPGARILFISENRSWDITQAALATGARGYVWKPDVAHDLLPALEAITAGGRFLSARFGGTGAVPARETVRSNRCHEALFSTNQARLVEGYVTFAERALTAGSSVIILASDANRAAVQQTLEARGLNMTAAIRQGRYLPLTVDGALAAFLVDGWPEESQFWSAATALFMKAARAASGPRPHVAACGECAPTLWRAGRGAAAIRLEQLWDGLTSMCAVDIFCAYSSSTPLDGPDRHVYDALCAEHSVVHAS